MEDAINIKVNRLKKHVFDRVKAPLNKENREKVRQRR